MTFKQLGNIVDLSLSGMGVIVGDDLPMERCYRLQTAKATCLEWFAIDQNEMGVTSKESSWDCSGKASSCSSILSCSSGNLRDHTLAY